MEYPISPFPVTFDKELITKIEANNDEISNEEYHILLKWLTSCPNLSSYRANTLKNDPKNILNMFRKEFDQSVHIELHSLIPNVIIVYNKNVSKVLMRYNKEIIVDSNCASAVLRGADIFAPGILGMTSGTQVGDMVSIYADLNKKCKRGFHKIFPNNEKLFIGNGIAKMQRHQLFNVKTPTGIAVEVIETLSGCVTLKETSLYLTGDVLLQNLPSILCVLALNPQPGNIVLDMCASPGNKTTHIAELMNNTGVLIAIDKTQNKVKQLNSTCKLFEAKVQTFVADSTKIVTNCLETSKISDGPPFLPQTFDKILLDAPCSGLGKRPQLTNRMSDNEIKSYAPLQKKLMKNAVELLKPGGILVYSTCTITLSENEGIVAWTLKNFSNLQLIKPKICLGNLGWAGTSLSDEERQLVQRFGPGSVDSVGFFYACFIKT